MSEKTVNFLHKPRKRFGQNFLRDNTVISQIIQSLSLKNNDNVVEIGPGLGALTSPISSKVNQLHVVEIDRDIVKKLSLLPDYKKMVVHEVDALSFDFSIISGKKRIVGNLPYNISTPLLFHLANYSNEIKDMHFMLQKEVVDRIVAKPHSSHYGRLSVMLQYLFDTVCLLTVPPSAFWPAPKVHSAVIRLVPSPGRCGIVSDHQLFASLVSQAFCHRRKTLNNNLKHLFSDDDFKQLSILPSKRPENISVEEYVLMTNFLACKP